MFAFLVIVVVVLIAVAAVVLVLQRRHADPVDSFRRQIDALSPEARRPTISQAPGDSDAGADATDDDDDRDDGAGGPDGS